MTSNSEGTPSHSNDESDSPYDTTPAANRTEKLKGKQDASPTIQAIRIPADGTPLHIITLPLVKAAADHHSGLRDPTLSHRSSVNEMRAAHHHGVEVPVPLLRRSENNLNPL